MGRKSIVRRPLLNPDISQVPIKIARPASPTAW